MPTHSQIFLRDNWTNLNFGLIVQNQLFQVALLEYLFQLPFLGFYKPHTFFWSNPRTFTLANLQDPLYFARKKAFLGIFMNIVPGFRVLSLFFVSLLLLEVLYVRSLGHLILVLLICDVDDLSVSTMLHHLKRQFINTLVS